MLSLTRAACSSFQVLAEKIIGALHETKHGHVLYSYRVVKEPSDEDPCGLLLCWEGSTSFLAVQLPQAASTKITVVIGLDYVSCRGGRESR